MFDLHNCSTDFNQCWPLVENPTDGSSMSRQDICLYTVCITRVTSQLWYSFASVGVWVGVWHCCVCLMSCSCVWQWSCGVFKGLWCEQAGCLCNVQASQLHLTALRVCKNYSEETVGREVPQRWRCGKHRELQRGWCGDRARGEQTGEKRKGVQLCKTANFTLT